MLVRHHPPPPQDKPPPTGRHPGLVGAVQPASRVTRTHPKTTFAIVMRSAFRVAHQF
jgi:hypothetical protein